MKVYIAVWDPWDIDAFAIDRVFETSEAAEAYVLQQDNPEDYRIAEREVKSNVK